MKVEGIIWMGVRSPRHGAMHDFLADVMGMEVAKAERGVTWFTLPGGEEIQIYDDADVDHAFFGNGPVIGFRVRNFAEAERALTAAGIEWLSDGDASAELRWRHFRAPDGNVYEILGPNEPGSSD
jgi:catechol 2,3-dioxygenase-like lactoylglutathione lyase family enzyme